MSYNLHVTYRKDWSEEKGKQIAHKLFVDYVDADPQNVNFDPHDSHKITAIFKIKGSDDEWAIRWEEGNIRADMRVVPKEVAIWMLDFAETIGAKLLGDEGEAYARQDVENMDTIAEWDARIQQSNIDNKRRLAKVKSKKIIKRVAITLLLALSTLGLLFIPFVWYGWLKDDKNSRYF